MGFPTVTASGSPVLNVFIISKNSFITLGLAVHSMPSTCATSRPTNLFLYDRRVNRHTSLRSCIHPWARSTVERRKNHLNGAPRPP